MMVLLLSSVSASAISVGGVGNPDLEGTFPIQFTDGGAESGNMSAWTTTGTAPTAEISAANIPGPYVGTHFFSGGLGSYGEMYERLAVPAAYTSAVDAGNGQLIAEYRYGTHSGSDTGEVYAEFFDYAGDPIGTRITSDTETPHDTMDWAKRTFTFAIPVDARSVIVGWAYTLVAGTLINAYLDDLKVTWVDKTTNPKTGIRLANYAWNGSGVNSTSAQFTKTYKEAGTYIVGFCTSADPGDDGEVRPVMTTATPGVTIGQLIRFELDGSFDSVSLYEVTISSPNTSAVFDATIDTGRFYRWLFASWLIENGDLSHILTFTTKNNTKVSNTLNPLDGSALAMVKFSSSGPGAEGQMGAPAGTYDGDVSAPFYMNTATGFDFPAEEITLTDTDNATRQVTVGVFIPPIIPGGYPTNLEGTYPTALVNPGAEAGDMTGWDTDNAVVVTSASDVSGPHEGTYFFTGGPDNTSAYMSQIVAFPASAEAEIAAGNWITELVWQQGGFLGDDDGTSVTLTFYTAALNPVKQVTSAFVDVDGEWQGQNLASLVPETARAVEVRFDMLREGGTYLNCYVDNISLTNRFNGSVAVDNSASYIVTGATTEGATVNSSRPYVVSGSLSYGASVNDAVPHLVLGNNIAGPAILYQSTHVILT